MTSRVAPGTVLASAASNMEASKELLGTTILPLGGCINFAGCTTFGKGQCNLTKTTRETFEDKLKF